MPALLRALDHADAQVSKLADEALTAAKLDKSHVPALGTALGQASSIPARLRMLDLLEQQGADGAGAVSGLRTVIKNARGEVLLKAIHAVSALGPAAREAGPELALLVQDNDPKVKLEATLALAATGSEQVVQAVPALVRALRLPEPNGQDEAARKEALAERNRVCLALIQIGRPALPRLIDALEGEYAFGTGQTVKGLLNADARLAIVQVLAQIGTKVKAPEILRALAHVEGHDPFHEIKMAARKARIAIQTPK